MIPIITLEDEDEVANSSGQEHGKQKSTETRASAANGNEKKSELSRVADLNRMQMIDIKEMAMTLQNNCFELVEQTNLLAQELNKIKEKVSRFESCNVCLRQFTHDIHRPLVLSCGHSLCKKCRSTIYSIDARCYMCRKSFLRDPIITNYALLPH